MVNVVEEYRSNASSGVESKSFGPHMMYTTIFVVASFGLLLLVMMLHQHMEEQNGEDPKKRRFLRGFSLGIGANSLGALSLGAFIYLKLRELV